MLLIHSLRDAENFLRGNTRCLAVRMVSLPLEVSQTGLEEEEYFDDQYATVYLEPSIENTDSYDIYTTEELSQEGDGEDSDVEVFMGIDFTDQVSAIAMINLMWAAANGLAEDGELALLVKYLDESETPRSKIIAKKNQETGNHDSQQY